MAKSDKPYKATDKNKQSVKTPETDESLTVGKETEEAAAVDARTEATEKPEANTPDSPLSEKVADAHVADDALEDAARETKDTTADPKDSAGSVSTDADKKDHDDVLTLTDKDVKSAEQDEKPGAEKTPWGERTPEPDTTEPAPEPDPVPDLSTPPVVPTPAPQTKIIKASPWPALFGGLVAAAIGFVVGRGDVIDQYLPEPLQRPTVDTSAITADIAAVETQTAELEAQIGAQDARLDALETASADDVLDMVAALETDLETLAAQLAALESRPAAPAGPSGAPVEAVEELQSALADQNAQIAALAERAQAAEAQAAGEAARLLARAALIRVQTALDSGETFDTTLADLEAVAPVEIPDRLREAAEAGVPTLAGLQASFPDAARAGLAAARAEIPESEVVGITGFIQRQLNVRSVTPREGDDPDAILSRVQGAVSSGDLETALTEAEALPEAARTAMNDWLEAATARRSAQQAADTLADSLDSN